MKGPLDPRVGLYEMFLIGIELFDTSKAIATQRENNMLAYFLVHQLILERFHRLAFINPFPSSAAPIHQTPE